MYKHILIATDGSELALKAVEHGLGLAQALSAKATVITVTLPWEAVVIGEAAMVFPPDNYRESAAITAAQTLADVKEIAAKKGAPYDGLHVTDRHPAEGIAETARTLGCDLIVMASHGRRGLGRLVLGSIANEVVTQSTIPVLVVR